MKNDMDAQFLCKDCSRFNLCKYYDRRKEDSYICKYFHLAESYWLTNGDVIVGLYPDLKYTIRDDRVITTIGVASSFDLEWWNAPYKKEVSE